MTDTGEAPPLGGPPSAVGHPQPGAKRRRRRKRRGGGGGAFVVDRRVEAVTPPPSATPVQSAPLHPPVVHTPPPAPRHPHAVDPAATLAAHAPHHAAPGERAAAVPHAHAHPHPSQAARPHLPHGRRGRAYAALDLGTNNCRLLVAEPQTQGFRVVDAFSRIVRLGEGITQSGRLSEEAMDRAVEALAVCRRKLEDRAVERFRLIATEACRRAENGEEFLARVREEVGLDLEIVDRETEARLAVAGCASLVDPRARGVILFDIGGGSSELVWIDLTRGPRLDPTACVRAWASLPLGVVTLSENHGGVDVDDAVFEAMIAEVESHLHLLPDGDQLARQVAKGGIHLLGTSGTVTTLAGVHLGLRRYDRRRVDGTWLGAADVTRMIQRVRAMSFADRVANPCIGRDRADLVLAGCAILEAIRRRWSCGRLRVADRGLREGILTEMMLADGVWDAPGRGRVNGEGRR